MTSERRPAWLAEAFLTHRARPGDLLSALDRGVGRPERGDVVLVEAMDASAPSRLCLILDVNEEYNTAGVALLSNLVENATDLDVSLTTELTDLPFELLVEADVVGTAWQWQLSALVGRLPVSLVDVIERLPRLSDPIALSMPRGMPLTGTSDVRWTWKESEVIELQLLTADCVRTLVSTPTVDVGFLGAESLDRDVVRQMVLTATELVSAGLVAWPSEAAEALGLDQEGATDRMIAELGPDAWLAMNEMLIGSVRDEEQTSAPDLLPHRRVDPSRDPLLRVVGGSAATVRVVTWGELWDDPAGGVLEIAIEGATKRVVRELVAA